MRRRLLLVLSLFLLFATKGQAWVDYEYWFDNDRSTVQSGTSASTTLQLELDVSALSSALHALHVQVMNSDGERGAVVTHYFFKVSGVSSLSGHYWFDSDYSTVQTTSVVNGTFDIDVSALKEGLHAFHYQTIEGEKAVSPVQTAMFFKSSEMQGAMKIRYCVDGNMQNVIEGVRTGDTFQFDLDMNSLSDGLHTLAYSFADERDARSRVYVQYFWKNNRFTAPVAKYFYWLNDKEAEADSVEVNQPSDPFTLIMMLPIEPQPIRSKQFAFAVEEGKPVVYARNDIHLRFMNMAGLYDETSASFTDINVHEGVEAILLTPGGSHTANRPDENVIRWYKAIAQQGDSLAFKLNAEASMQVFSPTGEELLNVQGADVLDYKPVFASADGTYYVAVHDVTDTSVQQVTINYRRIHDGGEVVPLAGIAFAEPHQTVYPGESVNVTWTATPENATGYEVKLDYDDTVFGPNAGNASTLTVRAEAHVGTYEVIANAFDTFGNDLAISDTLTVTVWAHVAAVSVNGSLTLDPGDTADLTALVTVLPDDAHDKSYTVTSNNNGVVTVHNDNNGKWTATAVSTGETTMTVTSTDNPSATAAIPVKVTALLAGVQFVEPQQTVFAGESVNTAWTPVPADAVSFSIVLTYDESVFEKDPSDASLLTVKADVSAGEYPIVANGYDKNGNPLDISATLTVTVRTHLKEIQVISPLELTVGETIELLPLLTFVPADAYNKSYGITSDNNDVVKVNPGSNGFTATGIRAGTATLTVVSGENPDVTAEIAVTVTVTALTNPLEEELDNLQKRTQELQQELDMSRDKLAALKATKEAFAIRFDTLQAMLDCFSFDTPDTHAKYEADLAMDRALAQLIADRYDELHDMSHGLSDSIDYTDHKLEALKAELTQVATVKEVEELTMAIASVQSDCESMDESAMLLLAGVEELRVKMQELDALLAALKAELVANVEGMTPQYTLTLEHLSHLAVYPKLRYLDLSRSSIEGDALPDGVFSQLGLVSVILPPSLTAVGNGIFDGCSHLACLVWNNPGEVTESTLAGVNNPNLLLYVGDYSQALRSGVRNIVSDGIAQRITLTDNIGEDGMRGPSGFHVPQPFRVQNDISYTHTYTQPTPIGDCGGWETIALPFDVQTVTHAVNGETVPFAAYTPGKRPFWLCRLTEDGFVDADSIRANTPYIIAMPNNPQYSPFYCLNGEVTFSARGVTVPATVLHPASRAGASLIPTFDRVPASPYVYALNVGEARWGYAKGSLFDRDYRDVHPFEAYRTTTAAGVPFMAIGDELRGTTGIDDLIDVNDPEGDDLYDLSGRRIEDRPAERGVYIRNRTKVVVK